MLSIFDRLGFAAIIISFASTAMGQEIPQLQQDRTPVGTVGVYERPDGSRFATRIIKFEKGQTTYESREGETGDGSLINRVIHDEGGHRLSWADGEATWLYDPHACYRVIGDCTYNVKNASSGKSYRNTIRTEYDGAKVSWKRYYNGNIVSTGWYEIDPESVWISSYANSRNGDVTAAKLVKFALPQ